VNPSIKQQDLLEFNSFNITIFFMIVILQQNNYLTTVNPSIKQQDTVAFKIFNIIIFCTIVILKT
jgi:hypothetical protein